MSNPQAIFFDTSILVALLNKNPSEHKIAEQAFIYAEKFPHSALSLIFVIIVQAGSKPWILFGKEEANYLESLRLASTAP